eukprot:s2035_g6.t1
MTCAAKLADHTFHATTRLRPRAVAKRISRMSKANWRKKLGSTCILSLTEAFMSFSQQPNFLCSSIMRFLFTNANPWAQSCTFLFEGMSIVSLGK